MVLHRNTQPAPHGRLTSVVHMRNGEIVSPERDPVWWADPENWVRDDLHGHYPRSRRKKLMPAKPPGPSLQQRLLTHLRDTVHPRIPHLWYRLVLGHDLHVSVQARLYAQHFHAEEFDPFTGQLGWLENLGLQSEGKITTAFRDFEISNLVTDLTTYGDFKYHEVGTSSTAENNTQTALVTPSGVARVAGTQVVAAADTYRSVATVTATGTQTWTEHGLFNALTVGTMMDRSLIGSAPAVVAGDTVTFTYEIQKVAEA